MQEGGFEGKYSEGREGAPVRKAEDGDESAYEPVAAEWRWRWWWERLRGGWKRSRCFVVGLAIGLGLAGGWYKLHLEPEVDKNRAEIERLGDLREKFVAAEVQCEEMNGACEEMKGVCEETQGTLAGK